MRCRVHPRGPTCDALAATAPSSGTEQAAPLGLCFLPAFVRLATVPVVIGSAARVLDGPLRTCRMRYRARVRGPTCDARLVTVPSSGTAQADPLGRCSFQRASAWCRSLSAWLVVHSTAACCERAACSAERARGPTCYARPVAAPSSSTARAVPLCRCSFRCSLAWALCRSSSVRPGVCSRASSCERAACGAERVRVVQPAVRSRPT